MQTGIGNGSSSEAEADAENVEGSRRWPRHRAVTRALVAWLSFHVRNLAEALRGRKPTPETGSPPPPPVENPLQIRAWPTQVYSGYSAADLSLFDRFSQPASSPLPGFITDFLGVKTRASFLAGIKAPDGVVLGLPIPTDNLHAETVEWIGLLKCVSAARGHFVGMELGAGYGPWVVAAAVAARHVGITDIHLTAVEADPGHFTFMQEHFRDNGLEPEEHDLVQAAVGVEDGEARWPVIADPAADWGSRPATREEDGLDYLGRIFDEWMDIKVVSFSSLLCSRPVWDMVHIDVQGWEADLCRSTSDLLGGRIRWLIVATHTHLLHGIVMDQMHRLGWRLENEKPPRMQWRDGMKDLQNMTVSDGTQVWRNPALA